MMGIGVAIIGGGIFAYEEHLPAVQAAPTLALKAVYSRSLESVQKFLTNSEHKISAYSDDSGRGKGLNDLLSREDIQAVVIALPINSQPDYVRKALRAGKHVLSEKPIAENIADALALISWYEKDILPGGTTWAIAENARFWNTVTYVNSRKQSEVGKALTFRARMQKLVEGGKYFETGWRKAPTHQGGFVLDGGIHLAAALRMILGVDDPIVSISAYTTQLQKHLPPVDTVEAIARTQEGSVGSISISFGTTAAGLDYHVGGDRGSVFVTSSTVQFNGKEENVGEISGVMPEVAAWGAGIVTGHPHALQSPREALADLEIIEACLRSGERGGIAIELVHQRV